MNHIYRVVFNPELGLWQAVAECARGRGKSKTLKRGGVALAAAAVLGAASLPALAVPLVSATGNVTPAPAPAASWALGFSPLFVGKDSTGTLTIEGGGVVANGAGFVGGSAGVEGAVRVTGAGSAWGSARSATR